MQLIFVNNRGRVLAKLDDVAHKTRRQIWRWILQAYAEARSKNAGG